MATPSDQDPSVFGGIKRNLHRAWSHACDKIAPEKDRDKSDGRRHHVSSSFANDIMSNMFINVRFALRMCHGEITVTDRKIHLINIIPNPQIRLQKKPTTLIIMKVNRKNLKNIHKTLNQVCKSNFSSSQYILYIQNDVPSVWTIVSNPNGSVNVVMNFAPNASINISTVSNHNVLVVSPFTEIFEVLNQIMVL